MAVTGLKSFADHFKGYEDCYTSIGGTACEILMSEIPGMQFRATNDIDMIILFEDKFEAFAKLFWEYIKEGDYTCGWKNSAEPHFYRFTKPRVGYPVQIELFSRKPDYHLKAEQIIVPIYVDDDTSSLSAILLNDDFYNFMLGGRTTANGLSILRAEYLIPFKMYAWLNLLDEKRAQKHVNTKDLHKHKNDVFLLLQIVPGDIKVSVSGAVAEAVNRFLDEITNDNIVLKDLGINSTLEEETAALREMYVEVSLA